MLIKAKLVKLSICECGYGLLLEQIKLGTEFMIHAETVDANHHFALICGGCKKVSYGKGALHAECVTNPASGPALLPIELFEFDIAKAVSRN